MKLLRVRSQLDSKTLCGALDSLDAIAISINSVGSLEEFELAYHLAKRSFEKKKNIARKLKYEFILWLAGKNDIKSAMEATTPLENDLEFFVVVFSDSSERKVLIKLDAKKISLRLKKSGDPIRLEMISLSRVKN